jgi:TRAP-type C4-dicarboxylate transport system permease small subunit
MDRLVERARTVSRYGVWFGGFLIVLAAVIIGIEVVIRKAFNVTIGGADELSGFALAIGSAWAFGFALLDRAHVRIDSVYTFLPARIRAPLDILGLIVFALFMGLFAWQALDVLVNSVAMNTRTMTILETPVMYPQFLWVLGLFSFVLIAALLLVRAVVTFVLHGALAVQKQIGSKTVQEEVDEELRQLETDAETPGESGP